MGKPYRKRIHFDRIGTVLFERSKKAKHLNISIQPFKEIRVAVPVGLTFKKAEEIFHSKREWTEKHLDRMKKAEQEINSRKKEPEIDRKAAKEKLVNRLNELAEKHGFEYNKVFIRNQKTRWGSCSAKNNISLNMKLVTLPDELIDYVILHELVHLKFRRHTENYWKMIGSICVDARKKDIELNEYKFLLRS